MEISYLASDTKDNSPYVNQFVVIGNGNISLVDMERAVFTAAQANPRIKLQLEGRWKNRRWKQAELIPEVIEYRQSWDGLSRDKAFFADKPLDCRKGPNAQVILNRAEQLHIIFRVHHAICDGAGMMHWIKEIFRALRSEELLGSLANMHDYQVAQNYFRAKPHLEAKPWSPINKPNLEAPLNEFIWKALSIQGDSGRLVPKLLCNIAKLCRESFPAGNVCIRIPSDLRRLVDDDGFQMGNLTGSIDFEILDSDNEDSLYKKILAYKRRNLDLSVFRNNLGIARWLPKLSFKPADKFFRKLYKNDQCNISAIISHLGKVKADSLATENFAPSAFYPIPIPIEGVSLSLGIVQLDSMTLICISIPKSFGDQDQLNKLEQRFKALLQTS